MKEKGNASSSAGLSWLAPLPPGLLEEKEKWNSPSGLWASWNRNPGPVGTGFWLKQQQHKHWDMTTAFCSGDSYHWGIQSRPSVERQAVMCLHTVFSTLIDILLGVCRSTFPLKYELVKANGESCEYKLTLNKL